MAYLILNQSLSNSQVQTPELTHFPIQCELSISLLIPTLEELATTAILLPVS